MATFYVGTGNNDGSKQAGGSWDYTSNEFYNGILFGDAHTSVIRFSSVTIPQGSTINSATLKGYTSSANISGTVRMKIYGIDEDNTATLTSDPTGRTKTTAAADWDISINPGTASHTSPSIVSVLQEIVNRGGWLSGNSLGFIIVDDGSDSNKEQGWYSYEGDSNKDFELIVTWTAPASTTTSTSTSTSTSSSSTSSSSTTSFWVPSSDHMVALVTKEKKHIFSDVLNDFYLDSQYPLLKVHSYGTFTTSILGTKTITHSLGYIPYVLVFSQYADDNGAGGISLSTEFYQHDWLQEGATITFFGYTKIYANTINIVVGNSNSDRPGAINGFYYIFKEAV